MNLSGMVVMSSFWVNTDLKCWFSMLALDWLSDRMIGRFVGAFSFAVPFHSKG